MGDFGDRDRDVFLAAEPPVNCFGEFGELSCFSVGVPTMLFFFAPPVVPACVLSGLSQACKRLVADACRRRCSDCRVLGATNDEVNCPKRTLLLLC